MVPSEEQGLEFDRIVTALFLHSLVGMVLFGGAAREGQHSRNDRHDPSPSTFLPIHCAYGLYILVAALRFALCGLHRDLLMVPMVPPEPHVRSMSWATRRLIIALHGMHYPSLTLGCQPGRNAPVFPRMLRSRVRGPVRCVLLLSLF